MYYKAKQLKEIFSKIPDNTYVTVGTKENNEVEEIKKEYGIVEAKLKPIGFDNSNEKYLKLYTKKYEESGCMRFIRWKEVLQKQYF